MIEYICPNCGCDKEIFEDQKVCLNCGVDIKTEEEGKKETKENDIWAKIAISSRKYMFRNMPLALISLLFMIGATISIDYHSESGKTTDIDLPKIGQLGYYLACFWAFEPLITYSIRKTLTALNIDLRGVFHGFFRSFKDKKI